MHPERFFFEFHTGEIIVDLVEFLAPALRSLPAGCLHQFRRIVMQTLDIALPGILDSEDAPKKKGGQETRQHVTLARRRQAFSFIAVLADDDMIQKNLPQFFIVNAHTLSVADAKWLEQTQVTNNVFVQRRASAWLKASDLARIIRQIGRTLSPFRQTHAFIFCMDACPTHWTDVVARSAAESHLALVLIPPLTTSILQPLDVHVFHHIKRAARHGLENLQGEHPGEEISPRAIVHMWAKTVHRILQKQSWKRAFESCGFGAEGTCIGKRCRQHTGLQSEKYVSSDLPSLEDLHRCTTKRSRLPIGWWFHLALHNVGCVKSAAMTESSVHRRNEDDIGSGANSQGCSEVRDPGLGASWTTTAAPSAPSMREPRLPRAVRLFSTIRKPVP